MAAEKLPYAPSTGNAATFVALGNLREDEGRLLPTLGQEAKRCARW